MLIKTWWAPSVHSLVLQVSVEAGYKRMSEACREKPENKKQPQQQQVQVLHTTSRTVDAEPFPLVNSSIIRISSPLHYADIPENYRAFFAAPPCSLTCISRRVLTLRDTPSPWRQNKLAAINGKNGKGEEERGFGVGCEMCSTSFLKVKIIML